MIRAVVHGIGSSLPKRIVTNDELSKTVETSDEWIRERTGIEQRHIAVPGEMTSYFAAEAAKKALSMGGMVASDVGLLIIATTTPDDTIPSTATRVAAMLGIGAVPAFDIGAACTGFIYAMATADAYLKSGMAKNALIIGAETFSRVVDWKDRNTCILFGDGAGAMLLKAEAGKGNKDDRGVLATHLASDGAHYDILKTNGGVGRTGTSGTLTMQGKEVFKHAVSKMTDSALRTLAMAGVDVIELDLVVPHQANKRILSATAERLNLPPEKLYSSVERHANTSAASIPLALSEAYEKGLINKGMLLSLPALGAGLTWGSALLRW